MIVKDKEKRGDLLVSHDRYNINSYCSTIGNLLLSICKEEDLRAALFYEYSGLKQSKGSVFVAVIGIVNKRFVIQF